MNLEPLTNVGVLPDYEVCQHHARVVQPSLDKILYGNRPIGVKIKIRRVPVQPVYKS